MRITALFLLAVLGTAVPAAIPPLPVTSSPAAIAMPDNACAAFMDQMAASGFDVGTFLNSPPAGQRPQIHQALSRGDWDSVRAMLLRNADPTVRDAQGLTAYAVAERLNVTARFRELVVATQGADAKMLLAVATRLDAIGVDPATRFRVMDRPASEWSDEVRIGTLYRSLLDAAMDAQDALLVRYLVDVKGLSIAGFTPPAPEGDHEAEIRNYQLFAMALLEPDDGAFFAFLKKHNIRPFPRYRMAWGSNPAGLLFGHRNGVLSVTKYPPGAVTPNLAALRWLRDHGLNILSDATLTQAMFQDPVAMTDLFTVLLEPGYGRRNAMLSELALAFAVYQPIDAANLAPTQAMYERLVAAGVDFRAPFDATMPNETVLHHASSLAMGRFLLTVAKLDPEQVPGYVERMPSQAQGYWLFQIRQHQHHDFWREEEPLGKLVARHDRGARFRDTRGEWETALKARYPHDGQQWRWILDRIEFADYMAYDAIREFGGR